MHKTARKFRVSGELPRFDDAQFRCTLERVSRGLRFPVDILRLWGNASLRTTIDVLSAEQYPQDATSGPPIDIFKCQGSAIDRKRTLVRDRVHCVIVLGVIRFYDRGAAVEGGVSGRFDSFGENYSAFLKINLGMWGNAYACASSKIY